MYNHCMSLVYVYDKLLTDSNYEFIKYIMRVFSRTCRIRLTYGVLVIRRVYPKEYAQIFVVPWVFFGYLVSYWWIYMIKSLRPIDAIWWHKSWSALAQVMAWCLMAPSHYLNQCWLEDYWYPSQGNVTEKLHKIYAGKNYYFRLNIFVNVPMG